MTTKHTPGPWTVGFSADNFIMAVKAVDPVDGLRFELCEVWGENDDKSVTPMSSANASLISAAPDLLAALLACQAFLFPGEGTGFIGGIDDAERITAAAIAKATAA